jgi:pyruvate dehydrogenase (quinone)/pyruvate oxidase
MARTTSDILVDALVDWGVEVIFGLPGDGINGVMEALRKRQNKICFIHVRHEESAAFMACALPSTPENWASGLGTSGPGGIHLLNGLYDAKLDHQPVLAITGHTFHDLIGTYTQQDVDLDRVFADVAAYSECVMGPTHVKNVADLACRTALSYLPLARASANFTACFTSPLGGIGGSNGSTMASAKRLGDPRELPVLRLVPIKC